MAVTSLVLDHFVFCMNLYMCAANTANYIWPTGSPMSQFAEAIRL